MTLVWPTALERHACPCEGMHEPDHEGHFIWIAFLHRGNDDPEYAGGTCWDNFVNGATCFFDWTSIYHCQVFFWNRQQRSYITFSVDALRDRVFYSARKRFSRGWSFVRLRITPEAEIAMYNFFLAQLESGARFNCLGSYAVLFRPIDLGPGSYFCSQLVVAALHAAGYFAGIRDYATSPAALHALLHRRSDEFLELRHLGNENPVAAD
jgi:hypothetical protein